MNRTTKTLAAGALTALMATAAGAQFYDLEFENADECIDWRMQEFFPRFLNNLFAYELGIHTGYELDIDGKVTMPPEFMQSVIEDCEEETGTTITGDSDEYTLDTGYTVEF